MARLPKASKKVPRLGKPVKYSMAVPGSKSYINRALMCAALAKGKSTITDPNYCDDVLVLCKALQKLGVEIQQYEDKIIVHGVGGKFTKPSRPLHMGNAGTATRFLLPHIPAGATITGNSYMQQRPVQDLLDALHQVGYHTQSATGCPPVKILQNDTTAHTLTISGSLSSQYISSLLMLAPTLPNGLTIRISGKLVSQPYIDMTLSVMEQFGVQVTNHNYRSFTVTPQAYHRTTYHTPGDASSATYLWSLAAITGSHITITNVPTNSEQADAGLLAVLAKMGCTVLADETGSTVVGPQELKPGKGKTVKVNMRTMPDAVLSLAMVAAVAQGTTVITNVHHLKVKETNRLAVLAENLRRVGVGVKVTDSTIEIRGTGGKLLEKPTTIRTHDDHRFAMAFAVLGSKLGNVVIDQPGCVSKSYPTFGRMANSLCSRLPTRILCSLACGALAKPPWPNSGPSSFICAM